jgi:metal-responsive CopG/Arc/MetJ family transcriptional regulator
MSPPKNKHFTISIENQMLEDFRQMCKENGWNMSRRVRRFIELDLTNFKKRKLQEKRFGESK